MKKKDLILTFYLDYEPFVTTVFVIIGQFSYILHLAQKLI